MKAVLEFNYPQDEEKLRCALQGEASMAALRTIHDIVKMVNPDYNRMDFTEMRLALIEIQRLASMAFSGQGTEDSGLR